MKEILSPEITIYNANCFDILKQLPDKSVNLILSDPPYYKIKTDSWDNQWKKFDDYLDWIEKFALECKRVLKDNGSFYIFGDDKIIAYIQVRLDKHFTLLNNLVWYKRHNLATTWAHNNRCFTPVSERILFYGLQDRTGLETVMLDANNFQSLRKYFYDVLCFIGKNLKQIEKDLGHRKAEHCFYYKTTQWD